MGPAAADEGGSRTVPGPAPAEEPVISRIVRRLSLLVAVPGVMLGLSACSNVVAAADVATQAEDALELETGTRPDITCPEDLAGEVNAAIRCDLAVEGDDAVAGVNVVVTDIVDNTAQLSIEVVQ